MRRVRAAVGAAPAVIGLLLLATGCAPARSIGAAAPLHVVQADRGGPVGSTAHVRVQRVAAVTANTAEWTVDGVDESGSTLAMHWVDGSGTACGAVNRVEVAERTDAVVVGLVDTARDPSLSCAAVGVPRTFDLRLRRPLAGRALLEPASGVNDGLPHFAALMPPIPHCSTNANPSDTPIGMADAGERFAPTGATEALVCRTAWPDGRARTTFTRVSDLSAVRRLVAALNGARDRTPQTSAAARCASRSPGAWYAVYLTAPSVQVEVLVDEINCGVVENGAIRGRTTSAIHRVLAGLFSG